MLESAACLSVFYLFYYFFLKKENCFNYNRYFLLAAVLFSVIFPLIHVSYNPSTVPTVLNNLHEASNEVFFDENTKWKTTISGINERPFFFWWEALAFGYSLIAIFFGLRLFVQIKLVRDFIWYKRQNIVYHDYYFQIDTEGVFPTFSFFNYLFWDSSQKLTQEEADQIMTHEKVHIKQRHSIDIMLMELLKVIFWFNPLMYLYKSTFEEVHEYEADYIAVKQGNKTAYTRLLVKLVFDKMGFNLGSHFAKNKTLKRVDRIKANKRTNVFKFVLPLPLVALLFFIFACDSIKINHQVEINEIAYQAGFTSTSNGSHPYPDGSMADWIDHVTDEIEFSSQNEPYPMNGTITVIFEISSTGKIKNVHVPKPMKEGYDKIAVEVLENSKNWNWTPAKKNGVSTKSKVKIPIQFKMS